MLTLLICGRTDFVSKIFALMIVSDMFYVENMVEQLVSAADLQAFIVFLASVAARCLVETQG